MKLIEKFLISKRPSKIIYSSRLSIRMKLSLMITMLFIVLTSILFVTMVSTSQKRTYEEVFKGVNSFARMTAHGVKAALDLGLTDQVTSVLKLASQNRDVIYLVLTDSSGEPVTGVNTRTALLYGFKQIHNDNDRVFSDSVYFLRVAIEKGKKNSGDLFIAYSLKYANAQLANVQIYGLIVSAFFVLFGFLGSLFIGKIISEPITKLVESFGKVSSGDLKVRSDIKSGDETGKLSESFNEMVESLEFAVNELATSNALIKESEELYKELVAKLPDFVILHRNQKIFLVNEAIHDVLGYQTGEVIGRNIFEFVSSEFHSVVEENTRRRLSGEEIEPYEIEMITKCGDKITGEIRGSQIFYQRELAVLNVIVNVTARKKYEQRLKDINTLLEQKIEERTAELSEAVRKLQCEIDERINTEKKLIASEERALEASRLKSEFLANMSHEIRTPLNAILGFTNLLALNVDDPKLNHYVESIKAGGKNLLTLINDILDLSKIEAGKLDLHPAPLDLRAFIEEIKNIFTSKIQEKLISFELVISDEVPPVLILDEVRTRQILFNLIGNAVKFTDNGTITLKVENRFKLSDRSKIDLLLSVEDTGIGIPHEFQNEIFDSFKQHTHGTDRNYGGTGLGLSITKRLVEMMGGTISVESEPGKGSKFSVIIHDVSASSVREKLPEMAIVNKPFFTFSGKKILIADDVKTNREMLAELFKPTESRIIFASNGEEAYRLAKINKPDIVFMDLRMPVLDGNHAAKMIRENKELENTHVVAITASALKEEIDSKFLPFFEGYIIKPVDIYKIINLTNSLLGDEPTVSMYAEIEKPRREDGLRLKDGVSVDDLNARIALTVYPLYTTAVKSRLMSDVIAFAAEVRSLHEFSGVKVLLVFADELNFAANSFDIELINKNLNSFPSLIEEIRDKNISPPEDA